MSQTGPRYERLLKKKSTLALTNRQRQLLRCFAELQAASGGPPTIRALAKELGIKSPNGVMSIMLALARKGYLLPPDSGESRLCWRLADEGIAQVRCVIPRWPYVRIRLHDPEVALAPRAAREFALEILAAADLVDPPLAKAPPGSGLQSCP